MLSLRRTALQSVGLSLNLNKSEGDLCLRLGHFKATGREREALCFLKNLNNFSAQALIETYFHNEIYLFVYIMQAVSREFKTQSKRSYSAASH